MLICADICIPEQATLTLDLKSASSSDLLDQAIDNLPTKLVKTKSTVSGDELKVVFQSPKEFSTAYIFPREGNLFAYTPNQVITAIDENTFEITLPLVQDGVESFSGIIELF